MCSATKSTSSSNERTRRRTERRPKARSTAAARTAPDSRSAITPNGIPTTPYDKFKVLLDSPEDQPALGFPAYAQAFAQIIRHSPPQFAIGVFGDWGTGKTTLMRAIERELTHPTGDAPADDVVTVWFNAWRYEREPHLIVPMLDTLREALVEWAEAHPQEEDAGAARKAAAKVGRAARALLAGFTLTARVPLGVAGVEATFDPSAVMSRLGRDDELADRSSSFYHASFNEMKTAIEEFASNGARRVVVFVDDLDRCLPLRALEVLESMKLFFDLEGFVFVAGLDQAIIERAIEVKYQQTPPAARHTGNGEPEPSAEVRPELNGRDGQLSPINGRDYVKKIFQVPFGLPRVPTAELDAFFNELIARADLDPAQYANFNQFVRPHLPYLAGDQAVNPREVKRLLNAYTLQLKMLSTKLPALRPEVVIALQTINFRFEWRRLYEHLAADPPFFQETVRTAINSQDTSQNFWLRAEPLPQGLLLYLAGVASPLLEVPDLEIYVSSAEITRTGATELLAAHSAVAQLSREVRDLDAPGSETQSNFKSQLERVRNALPPWSSSPTKVNIERLVKRADNEAGRLSNPTLQESPAWNAWKKDMQDLLARLEENLVALRQETSLGPQSA